MEKLKSTKKITLQTLKGFAKRNAGRIYSKEHSIYEGMIDGITITNKDWQMSKISKPGYYETGIEGIYTVGGGRDYFEIYNDGVYFGISVKNCTGKTILAIKK